jgi:cytochrome c oxidase accessory protein FixG
VQEEMKTGHQRRSSLAADGRRLKVRIADVHGRFTRWRRAVFAALIGVYTAAPFVQLHGHPLIFINILDRHFYLFGQTFNAQDSYLLFFLLAGGLLGLFVLTASLGRVWCGWGCPQTVFLEGVFRPIERWIEGPRHRQIALEEGPWSLHKLFHLLLKHSLYLAAALLLTHVFLSYFVSMAELRHWVLADPRQHWTAFLWMGAITLVIYGNFAWFREQTCLIVCPYGRLQSALTDDDSLVIGYDTSRGEPRGRKGTEGAGACVDCLRCVDVCPTGIDIREGLQLDCIGCANCVDACDQVMLSLGRPRGLVRYDSLNGLAGLRRRWWRPRLALYLGLFLTLAVAAGVAAVQRRPFEATLMRQQGLPYVLEAGRLRNAYVLHVVNKTRDASEFDLKLELPAEAHANVPVPSVQLPSLGDIRLPLIVDLPKDAYRNGSEVVVRTLDRRSGREVESRLRFLGP